MKRERIFGFDFVRAIATISIVVIHFNAIYLYTQPTRPDLMIFGSQFSNIYLGSWGVALFFILSGASLMYVYGGSNFKIGTFFKKRFLGIFPMFWLAYFFGLLLLFWLAGQFPFSGIPKIRFIFTILGIDGTISTTYRTFYILGEWFLGCIICMYIVFPILRFLINQFPKITIVLLLGIFCAMEFLYTGPLPKDVIFLTRLPEFCFGMYFVKYIKKVTWPVALISLLIVIANWIIKPQFIPQDFQVLYIGIASFLCLIYVAKFIEKSNLCKDLCGFISKYSYAIFLTHHVIITQITCRVDLQNLSWAGSFIMFALCCTLTIFSSILLFKLEKAIMNKINLYISEFNSKHKLGSK